MDKIGESYRNIDSIFNKMVGNEAKNVKSYLHGTAILNPDFSMLRGVILLKQFIIRRKSKGS